MAVVVAGLGLASVATGCTDQRDPVANSPGASTRSPDGAPGLSVSPEAGQTPTATPGEPSGPVPSTRRAQPVPAGLAPVAIPDACQLGGPADGVQRAADDGHLPWRLDPAAVVRECLRRDLGAAAWRVVRASEDTVTVAEAGSRFDARFHLRQPGRHGSGGIWSIAGIDATGELILPPACAEADPAGLQAAFDQGHQPWRGSPVMVAEACAAAAWGWPHPSGRLSAGHVLVVDDTTGGVVEVRGRPWRAGNSIWLVTSAEPEVGQD